MAANFVCDICGQVAADFMVTMIVNGDTVALGAECVAAWAEAIVSALDSAADRPLEPAQVAAEPAEGADAAWEAGFPAGRPDAAPRTTDGGAETVGEDTETPPAAGLDG